MIAAGEAAFTGDVHVEVHSGLIVRCLWSERSGIPPPPAQIAVRQQLKPPRLSQEERAAVPGALTLDTLTGKVVSLSV